MAEDRAPIWPDGLVGSITHAGGFAAAAVARAADIAGLGIDSEQIIDPAAAYDIADICMVDEARLFKAVHGRSFCEFCTLVFSAKEAVFKCRFSLTRKFFEFSDVQITSFDWSRNYSHGQPSVNTSESGGYRTPMGLCIPRSNCHGSV